MYTYLGLPTPSPVTSYRRNQVVHLPGIERGCRTFRHWHAHAAFGYLLPVHLVGTSSGRGPLPHLITSVGRRRLRSSPNCPPSRSISRQGSLPRLPTSAMPTPPPAVSYRRTVWEHLHGGGLCLAYLPWHAYAVFGNLLPAQPGGSSPRGGRGCHTFLHRHAHATVGYLLPLHLVGTSPGRGPLPHLITLEGRRRLRSCPTGAPSKSISWEGSVTRLRTSAIATSPPAVSYRFTQ